jgi:N-acetylglutamate synthase-like GNAT family acetyltransferase
LYKFQAHRDEQGKLTLVNPKTNERRSFSASLLKEFTHFDPQVTEQGKIYGWDHNPLEFSKKFLPNLFKAGTLDEADFRTQTGSAAAEKYGEHERPWLKPKAANYAGFSNSEGQFARYYLGRTEIGSTGIIIEPNMRPVALGPDMVGIVKDNGKGREVEAIFPLSTSAELFPLYEEAKKSFNGVKLTASEISQKIVVKKSEMKQKIRRYSATEFLPPRPGEDPVEYYKRLKPLDDPDFILSKVKKVFNGSDKGIHRLRWGEQLILARTLLEGLDEQRLSNFSKTYGLKGVRTFVSLDHGLKMGHDILEMGENLEPALAKAIFEKYSEIVDVSYKAQEYILNHIESEPGSGNESAIKIREQLLGKAKDFLIQMSNASKEKGAGLKSVQLLERLEGVKSEVLLFAATCRNLPPDSKVTLKELLEQRVEDKDSGQLSQEEKKEMQQIFKNNRSGGYPEKLFAETLSDFSKTINEPGHTFRILKENGQVVAFLHYDQVDAETIYVGSLNLHPSAKGEGPIATGMIKAALEENKDKNLTAVVWKNNPAAAFYIRALGFKNRGEIPDYHGTGETYIKLERPKQVAEVSELPKAA